MNIPFFYEDYSEPGGLTLSDANTHYLLNVLRMKQGEMLWITNGKGIKVLAVIINAGKRHADIEIREVVNENSRSSRLHVAIAFTKNATRMEWFLEKATELGIESITPLITHRSEKLFFKRDRFEKILIAAMLQSQQTFLPVLNESAPLIEVAAAHCDQKFIAYCGNEYPKQSLSGILKPHQDTLFMIGPEGDFTEDEVHLCQQHNFEIVQLGQNRLRTETAGLYVSTLFNAIQ